MDKVKFLNLGRQPIANGFLDEHEFADEFFYDLSVGFDTDTSLVTHMDYVEPTLMFNEDYSYRGSMSKTMQNHFREFSKHVKGFLPSKPKVLEIGSNDGVFLVNWDKKTSYAVEPCGNFAEETNSLGYHTYCDFWNEELSEKILEEKGKVDLVFAANCMCHIPDLDDAFSSVSRVLSNDGLFVFEDPSLAEVVNLNSYDQIYDEHPHIFSVTCLDKLLRRNGLSIVRVDNTSVHGGSNRIWAKKTDSSFLIDSSVSLNLDLEKVLGLDETSTFHRFSERVEKSKEDLFELLCRCREQGKKIISYGATSKSTTIFNYCGIDRNLISYITDTTPEKQNKFSPGMHIPIVPPEDYISECVDFAFLGAWNFATEIRRKEKNFKGKFITHVPTVRLI